MNETSCAAKLFNAKHFKRTVFCIKRRTALLKMLRPEQKNALKNR